MWPTIIRTVLQSAHQTNDLNSWGRERSAISFWFEAGSCNFPSSLKEEDKQVGRDCRHRKTVFAVILQAWLRISQTDCFGTRESLTWKWWLHAFIVSRLISLQTSWNRFKNDARLANSDSNSSRKCSSCIEKFIEVKKAQSCQKQIDQELRRLDSRYFWLIAFWTWDR